MAYLAPHSYMFRKLGELGRGSFGIVEKVQWYTNFRVDQTVYALKTVTFPKNSLDYRELNVIRDVCMKQNAQGQIVPSPYIVTVYNYWIEYDNPQYDRYCVLMELCEKSLETEITNRYNDHNPFSEKEIWRITCHIMEGIMVCHNLNYTHRDLKPANILWSAKTKTWKLSDFGIAAKLPASTPTMPASPVPTPFMPSPRAALVAIAPPQSNISHTRRGSPGYVAPELVYESIQSRKGDIWSLGCILYELGCGKMAFPPPPQQPQQQSQDPMWNYVKGNGRPPEVGPADNPKLYNPAVGMNCFGEPVSGRYRINQVVQWCLERDSSDRPKIWRLICHVKSIVMLTEK